MLKANYIKKLNFFCLLLLCCFFLEGNAQQQTETPWTSIWGGHGDDFTFEEMQESFNAYWKNRSYEKGKGYKQYKRWESYMSPRIYPSGDMTLPSTTYQNFMNWQRTQNAGARTGSSNWTSLGPFTKATGDDTGVGRLNMLRFDPTDSTVMYVGAPDGGLWKSTNSGASWTTNTDFLGVIGVSDLAIDSTKTSIMYLATGDIEGDRRSIGVLKSTDGGTTWNTTGLTWTATDNYKISKLLMNPNNPLNLLAATDGGVFRTIDGGVNWTSPSTIEDFKDMEFKQGDPNTVYASGTAIWKSTDNGVNWTKITSGLPTSNVVRIALGVTRQNGNYVYALIGRSDNNGLLGVYRSTDSGTSWTTQANAPNLLGYVADGSDAAGQAFYDLAITVSPYDKDKVTVGGVNQWQSTDGGVTWAIISHWDPTSGLAFVHADVHELTYSPSGKVIYSCHDGGLGKSENGGKTWKDVSNNLVISQQNSIGISALTATRYVAGLQDIGSISHKTATSWSVVGGGDGEDAFIDRTDDNYIVTTGTNGSHELSTNGGTSFSSIVSAPLLKGDANANFYSPIRQDPVLSTKYYAGGRNHLYVSTTEGSSWTQLGAPFGATGSSNRITEFHIAPNTSATIYAISGTAIAKSINSGTSWTDITGTLPTGTVQLSNLVVSHTDPNKVWVTFSGYSSTNKVYKSINGGTTWTNLSTGLPNLPANTIVHQNGSTNDDIYIGMDIGIYHIDNTTSTWSAFFTNLPHVRVKNLKISYLGSGKLRAATYGRGAWESDLSVSLPVELTRFSGENKGNENVLFWTTATETNLDYYAIERSVDGHFFETIGTIQSEEPNSTIAKDYTFADKKPSRGINYYRLKVMDRDRSFEYSKSVIIYVDNIESTLSIYPNPSVDFIEIKGLTDNVVLHFMDALGRPIRKENVAPNTKVDVRAFPNGTYFIEIVKSDKTSTIQRFIKQ
jgi:hypothetical protein